MATTPRKDAKGYASKRCLDKKADYKKRRERARNNKKEAVMKDMDEKKTEEWKERANDIKL